ncbi:TetR family transcriptional regulator [Thiolapillus sp.]
MSRIRAINEKDKYQKREAILDTAEQLWLENQHSVVSMDAVARAAGVAKGTLYLYFPGKEELFLALHERHVSEFFSRVVYYAGRVSSMDTDDMIYLVQGFIKDTPAFLPLASHTHGIMERQIPVEAGLAFQERIDRQLLEVVRALQVHFPLLTAALMLQSYALLLGLWQLLRPTPVKIKLREQDGKMVCTEDYFEMLDTALQALWCGAFAQEAPSPGIGS